MMMSKHSARTQATMAAAGMLLTLDALLLGATAR